MYNGIELVDTGYWNGLDWNWIGYNMRTLQLEWNGINLN